MCSGAVVHFSLFLQWRDSSGQRAVRKVLEPTPRTQCELQMLLPCHDKSNQKKDRKGIESLLRKVCTAAVQVETVCWRHDIDHLRFDETNKMNYFINTEIFFYFTLCVRSKMGLSCVLIVQKKTKL